MNGWTAALAAACMVVLAGVFGALHHALRDLSRKRMDDLVAARNGHGPPAGLDAVLDDPVGHALAAALPRMICEAAAVVFTVIAVDWFGFLFRAAGEVGSGVLTIAPVSVGAWDLVIGVVIALVALWVVALALPLAISEHVGEKLILGTVPLLRVLHGLATPVRRVLGLFDELVRRLSGEEERTEAEELREDLLDVVTEGERGGQLDESERGLIEAAVRFREIDAGRIMTPRTEISAIEYTDDLSAVMAQVVEIGHSRIPVFTESLDKVDGVLYAKDLLNYLSVSQQGAHDEREGGQDGGQHGGFLLRSILREAAFVPEGKSVRDLMNELIARGVHMALVADEYGGTSGLVTMEDIMEEAFGEIRDEYDEDELALPPMVSLDEDLGVAQAEAKAPIHEANAALRSIGVELPESEEYDTVGGLVVTELGRIPEAGEGLMLVEAGVQIEVLEAEPRRVVRVRIEPVSEADAEEEPLAEDGTP